MTTPDHLSRVVAVVARELRALSTTYAGAPGQRGLVEIAEDLERAAKLLPPSGPPGSVLGVRPDGVVAWGRPAFHGSAIVLDFSPAPSRPSEEKAPAPTPVQGAPHLIFPTSFDLCHCGNERKSHENGTGRCALCRCGSFVHNPPAPPPPESKSEPPAEAPTAPTLTSPPIPSAAPGSPTSAGASPLPRRTDTPEARAFWATVDEAAERTERLARRLDDWRPTSPAPETDGRSTT